MNNRLKHQDDDFVQNVQADSSHERAGAAFQNGRKAPSAFRTISEVADELNVQQHVLRFWETKFTQIKPLKRGGGRRYYRPEDVALLRKIHNLLYVEGYTIKGVQKLMKGQGRQQIAASLAKETSKVAMTLDKTSVHSEQETSNSKLTDKQKLILQAMLGDLKDLRDMIRRG